jgi:hypothetical protein
MASLSLDPGPIPSGKLPEWQDSGRTLSATLRGNQNELAAFVIPKVSCFAASRLLVRP